MNADETWKEVKTKTQHLTLGTYIIEVEGQDKGKKSSLSL